MPKKASIRSWTSIGFSEGAGAGALVFIRTPARGPVGSGQVRRKSLNGPGSLASGYSPLTPRALTTASGRLPCRAKIRLRGGRSGAVFLGKGFQAADQVEEP